MEGTTWVMLLITVQIFALACRAFRCGRQVGAEEGWAQGYVDGLAEAARVYCGDGDDKEQP